MEESECKRFKSELAHCPDNTRDEQPYPRLIEGREEELTVLFNTVGSLADPSLPNGQTDEKSTTPSHSGAVYEQRFITSSFKHPSILRSVSDKLPRSSHRRTHRRTSSTISTGSLGCYASFDETAEGFDNDIPDKVPSCSLEGLNRGDL